MVNSDNRQGVETATERNGYERQDCCHEHCDRDGTITKFTDRDMFTA